MGKIKRKPPIPITEWVWKTRDGRKSRLADMPRTHVQNNLNWCIRNDERLMPEWENFKDGHTYGDWITAFTVRLLDPSCE